MESVEKSQVLSSDELKPTPFNSLEQNLPCINEKQTYVARYFNANDRMLRQVRISNFSYKESISQIYSNSEIGLYHPLIQNIGNLIHPCPEQISYPENSAEFIAAQVAPIIDSSHKLSIRTLGIRLPKLNLFIHPLSRELISNEGDAEYFKYQTNNAIYFNLNNELNVDGSIAILPQSQSVIDHSNQPLYDVLFSGYPVWFFPFFPAHEYAHHIFKYEFFDKLNQIDQDKLLSIRVDKKIEYNKNKKIKRFLNFYEESFSDLFAIYSLPARYTHFPSIACLEHDREIDSPNFTNNELKALSKVTLDKFSNSPKQKVSSLCEPVKTSPYTLASISNFIIAHFLKLKFIKDHNNIEKLKFVFKFYQTFYLNQKNFKVILEANTKKSFILFYQKFFKLIFTRTKLKKEDCHFIRKYLPALKNELIQEISVSRKCLLI